MVAPPFALVHAPVLARTADPSYVAHRSAQEWFVGGPGFTDDDERRFTRIDLAELTTSIDIAEVLDLPVGDYAWRRGDEQPWQRGRIPVGSTFLLTCEVRPTRELVGRPPVGGAYANCWVVCGSLSEAEQVAAQRLENDGWAIIDTVGATEKRAEELADGTECHFRQVQIDGFVCVLHAFPLAERDLG